jgi:hypothetical protein
MQTRHEHRPRFAQLARERFELGPARVHALECIARERMFLDRNEVQAFAPLGVVAPRTPRFEEIDPETEAGLDDREDARAGPAPRQIVAAEENVARLSGPRIRAVIDVAVARRVRRAVAVE